ncbi:CDP-glycerol glycerophosphotransferase family protein [Cohnella phaseoli]|uniref:CDP-glycerol:poly(Glycerophosphate) glycerophosphotransferase n=1 Tax=Cohnella phaseoli TaxID=456490 RepID=A0A3D9KCF1_9BACL|nr:CDP-glycerol glycerophosphotransferase family protein [Cohnella phaseoli]RED83973.1 CDP-glycerol:poly(glycerophosphate) glycerophosphotransferase [Cohnella phaseoli]
MHYRFFKIAIQDCQAIITMLEKTELNATKRLWIKGIIIDLRFRISEDIHLSNLLRLEIVNHLEKIQGDHDGATSTILINDMQGLIRLLEQIVDVKIRIDIFFARPVTAVFLLLVYHQLRKYESVDVRIIAIDYYPADIYQSDGQFEQLVTFLESAGVEYIPYSEYDVFQELPDAVFYSFHNHTYMMPLHLQHSTLIPILNRTMFLEYALNPNDVLIYDSNYSSTPYTWLQFRTSEFSYNAITWGSQDIVTGHPLMDLSHQVFSGEKKISIPEEWIRLSAGKTTLLWNVNPVIHSDNSINFVGTKEMIIKTLKLLSDICNRYRSIFIIFRPHPLCFFSDLQIKFSELQAQIVVDQNPDSYPALFLADAFIGESSSLYAQFLPSHRPGLILNTPNYYNDYCDFIFWTQTNMTSKQEDIFEFIDNLTSDYSSMLRPITEIDKYCLGPMDGKSSQRISVSIVKKFYEEEIAFIRKYRPEMIDGITRMESLP